MKSIWLATALLPIATFASAADLPTMSPPPAAPDYLTPAPVSSWTGFYAGLHAGYVSASARVTDINGGVNPGPFSYSPEGGFGGGQIGFNYQFNNFGSGSGIVVGVEGDVGYMGLNGQGIIGSTVAVSHQDLTLRSGVYSDITGRLGFAFNKVMIYGKGGYAMFNGSAGQTTTNPGYSTTRTGTFGGWAAGAGIEYMITHQLSIKAEYMHYDFGSRSGGQTDVGDDSSPIGYVFGNKTALRMDTAKIGLNYYFN